jgi:hypothetical protein
LGEQDKAIGEHVDDYGAVRDFDFRRKTPKPVAELTINFILTLSIIDKSIIDDRL